MDNLSETKKHEIDLYHQWKKTQSPEHFQALYKSMKPIIFRAASKAAYGSNLPAAAHQIYAAQAFYDALRNYNPNSEASLSTFVHKSVENKVKRLNYQYQNMGSMPEPRAQIVGVYLNEQANLKATLGREPSTAEMADKLGIGLKQVANIQKELRKDLAMGEGTEEIAFAEGSRDEEKLNYLYYDLAPDEKVVFEYMFGKFGKPRLVKPNNKVDFEAIAKHMGVSVPRVRTLYLKIRQAAQKVI